MAVITVWQFKIATDNQPLLSTYYRWSLFFPIFKLVFCVYYDIQPPEGTVASVSISVQYQCRQVLYATSWLLVVSTYPSIHASIPIHLLYVYLAAVVPPLPSYLVFCLILSYTNHPSISIFVVNHFLYRLLEWWCQRASIAKTKQTSHTTRSLEGSTSTSNSKSSDPLLDGMKSARKASAEQFILIMESAVPPIISCLRRP